MAAAVVGVHASPAAFDLSSRAGCASTCNTGSITERGVPTGTGTRTSNAQSVFGASIATSATVFDIIGQADAGSVAVSLAACTCGALTRTIDASLAGDTLLVAGPTMFHARCEIRTLALTVGLAGCAGDFVLAFSCDTDLIDWALRVAGPAVGCVGLQVFDTGPITQRFATGTGGFGTSPQYDSCLGHDVERLFILCDPRGDQCWVGVFSVARKLEATSQIHCLAVIDDDLAHLLSIPCFVKRRGEKRRGEGL